MSRQYFRMSESAIQDGEYAIIRLNLLHRAGYAVQPRPIDIMDIVELRHPKSPLATVYADGGVVIGSLVQSDVDRYNPNVDDQRRFEDWVANVKPHWFTKARREGVLTTLLVNAVFVGLIYVLIQIFR